MGQGLLQGLLPPGGGVRGVGLQARELIVQEGRQRLGGAAHQRELVAVLQQQRHQGSAHKTTAAHQQNPHAAFPIALVQR